MGPLSFSRNRKRAAVTWTGMLGPASGALPASTAPHPVRFGGTPYRPHCCPRLAFRSVPAYPAAAASERCRTAAFVPDPPGPDRRCTGIFVRHCCPASCLLYSIKMIFITSLQPRPRIARKLRATRPPAQECWTNIRARQGASTPLPYRTISARQLHAGVRPRGRRDGDRLRAGREPRCRTPRSRS